MECIMTVSVSVEGALVFVRSLCLSVFLCVGVSVIQSSGGSIHTPCPKTAKSTSCRAGPSPEMDIYGLRFGPL